MTWRLFLDDVRNVDWIYAIEDPNSYVICRSFHEAVVACTERGCPSFISFDHDLGEDTPTGMDFARWLVERDLDASFFPEDFNWKVHSANPIGVANIEGLLTSYFDTKQQRNAG